MARFPSFLPVLLVLLQLAPVLADSMANRRGPVEALAISHDGKTIAANDGARVFLTNAQDGRVLRSLTGRGGVISSVAVSPDSSLVAVASDSIVELRDATTGTLLHVFTKPSGSFLSVAFSPNGRILAAGGVSKLHEDQPVTTTIGDVRMWEVRSLRLLRILRGDTSDGRGRFSGLSSIAFAPDGSTLAVGGALTSGKHSTNVELWDARTGESQQELETPLSRISSLAFSPDGSTLATGGVPQPAEPAPSVAVWDVRQEKLLRSFRASEGAVAVEFSRGGSTLAVVGTDGKASEWDVTTGKGLRELVAQQSKATTVTYSPDSTQLLVGYADGAVRAFADEAAPPILVRERGDSVSELTITPDGKGLLAAGNKKGMGSLQRLELASGKVQWSRPASSPIKGLAFSPDDETLVVGAASGKVDLWELSTMKHLQSFETGASLQSVALAKPKGKLLLAAATAGADSEEHRVSIWDALNGKEVQSLPTVGETARSLSFSPDGSTLLVAGENRSLGLWDVTARRWRWKLDTGAGGNAADFSADGRFIGTARWNGIEWRDAGNGRLIRRFEWPDVKLDESGSSNGSVSSVSVSADGKWVAGYGTRSGADGAAGQELRLWETATGNLLATSVLPHADGKVRFSPDGRQLLVGSADGVLQMLQIFPGEKSAVLWPLWRTGGAYRGLGRD